MIRIGANYGTRPGHDDPALIVALETCLTSTDLERKGREGR
jgi:hypothetical protein